MTDHRNRKPEHEEKLIAQEWESARARGRAHFIWKNGALRVGLPLGLILTAFALYYLGYSIDDLLAVHVAALAYVVISVSMVTASIIAAGEWSEREEKRSRDHESK